MSDKSPVYKGRWMEFGKTRQAVAARSQSWNMG